MKRFPIILMLIQLISLSSACTDNKKLPTREMAISLIEKKYPITGRRLEYSQIDSTDAELKGYFIGRIYIDNSDTIKIHKFHLNYLKTNIAVSDSFIINSDIYKALLTDDKIFSDDASLDFEKIQLVSRSGIDHNYYYNNDYLNISDSVRVADSIACIEAAALMTEY